MSVYISHMFYFAFSLCIIKPRRRLLYLLASKNMVFLRVLKLSGEELFSGRFKSCAPVAAIRARAAAALERGSCDLVAGNTKLRGDETVEAISLQDGDSLVAIAGRQLQCVAGFFAMAALKHDGSVLTWGKSCSGGDCASVRVQLTGGIEQVVAGNCAMAAVKRDGSVLTWGLSCFGGDSASVRAQLAGGIDQAVAGGQGPARFRIRGKRPSLLLASQERRQRC